MTISTTVVGLPSSLYPWIQLGAVRRDRNVCLNPASVDWIALRTGKTASASAWAMNRELLEL